MKKKKNRKPVRYKIIRFKLTARQKRSIENYCRLRGSTPNKIIKKQLRPLLENYENVEFRSSYVKAPQLRLFNIEGQDP